MANAKIWEQRIAAWRASGLTAAQYCAKEGLGQRALSRWSQRFQREPPPMRLARLVRAPEPALAPTGSSGPALVIEVGGARVTVGYGADISTVVTVLALVSAGGAR